MKLGLKASRWYLYFIPGSIIFFAAIVIASLFTGDTTSATDIPDFKP